MFTGLVEELGTITAVVPREAAGEWSLRRPLVPTDAGLGARTAVSGCCLTVVRRESDVLTFEAGSETLSRTNLGRLQAGSRVNLERSLRVGDRLGGHYVSGHVDGQGSLDERRDEGPWAFLWFRLSRD